MLDCHYFKEVNDQYYHLVGEQLLIHLCLTCEQKIRDIDFIARFNGEEFVLLLPRDSLDGALEIAKRIKDSCQ